MKREIESIDYGKWQKEQRKTHKMSQEQLAEKISSNKNTVSRYETGDRFPPLDVAERVVRVFGAELVIREKGNEETGAYR